MEFANELQVKAKRMKLVPDRKIKNNTFFVQIIQHNFSYLRKEGYLTLAEKGFLVDISEFVGFSSNCIVDDVKKNDPISLNQSDLARALEEERDIILNKDVYHIQLKNRKIPLSNCSVNFSGEFFCNAILFLMIYPS
ncbi:MULTISPECIES: hypothetical protein [Priestia]|uniref:hypothetical protein n=1 Tax=Priestia TaxID=2800373 RepID=UPI001E50B0CD|nr:MULTISPECIES: hypothetical protein [Priestia]MCM3796879.1 hypothetical protein [Priestia megaterium]